MYFSSNWIYQKTSSWRSVLEPSEKQSRWKNLILGTTGLTPSMLGLFMASTNSKCWIYLTITWKFLVPGLLFPWKENWTKLDLKVRLFLCYLTSRHLWKRLVTILFSFIKLYLIEKNHFRVKQAKFENIKK